MIASRRSGPNSAAVIGGGGLVAALTSAMRSALTGMRSLRSVRGYGMWSPFSQSVKLSRVMPMRRAACCCVRRWRAPAFDLEWQRVYLCGLQGDTRRRLEVIYRC